MNVRLVLASLGLAAVVAVRAQPLVEHEHNLWPVSVRYADGLHGETWTGAGPFLFRHPSADADGNTARGFRPFWVQLNRPQGDFREGYFLYPLFTYAVDENTYHWNVFELIRSWGRRSTAAAPDRLYDRRGEFEVFPFWFSRNAGEPEMSYRALFPIYGTVKNKLGFEHLSWTLFPLYVRNEKRGAVMYSTPWPVIRFARGAAHGWGVWPLFNYVERPGVSRHETYLWPLGYNSTRYPREDDPPGTPPRRDIGALPFYARSTGPGYINEDFAWPFFGYTERTAPKRYSERRYFWPLFVQGRGDERNVNRWAPFYTHSVIKGYDKHWVLWPLYRQGEWEDRGVARTRRQLLYFVYWKEQQRAARGATAFSAELTHVWPLFSRWANGAGREQWQVFSPLDVFFPSNEKVRHAWSPFFAIARHDRRGPGDARTSLLWNAVTWEVNSGEERKEFHLGPLLGVTQHSGEQRVAVGNGLFGFRRQAGSGWRMFWLDFPAKAANNTSAPALK